LELALQSDLPELQELSQHFAQRVVSVQAVSVLSLLEQPVLQVLVALALLEQQALQREPLVLLQQVQLVQVFPA
jgi:hypothetical protein